MLSDSSFPANPPVSLLMLGIGLMMAAVTFVYMGKVWVRLNGWVYRAKEPRWFWYEVALYILCGIGLIGDFLYRVYRLTN